MIPPLPENTISQTIGLYGEFNDQELAAVVAASRDVSAADSVTGHLLALNEQPHLVMLEREGVSAPNMEAYRSAVCLGATMLRRQARENGQDFSSVTVNPARRYLYFADRGIDEAHHFYQQWPVVIPDFTKPEYYSPFFEDEASAIKVKELQQRLVQNHIGFMKDLGPYGEVEMFSFFCRGLLDMFALYGHAEWEMGLAQPEDVFNSEKHLILDSPPEWGLQEKTDPSLRWRIGGLATLYFNDQGERDIGVQIGTTYLKPQHLAVRLYRGIGGFVRLHDTPDSPVVPVAFPASMEVFDLHDPLDDGRHNKDRLIIREYDSGASLFYKQSPPFLGEMGELGLDREIIGLCRNGVAYFTQEPHLNLQSDESALAAVLFSTKI